MLQATATIRVRYQETDKMGIAYHGNYFTWLEVARIHLLDSIDCPYKKMEKDGYLLPVIHCECIYKSPAKFDDLIDVEVQMPGVGDARLNLIYTLKNQEKLIAKAKTTHAFVDDLGKVVRPPRDFIQKAKAAILRSHSSA